MAEQQDESVPEETSTLATIRNKIRGDKQMYSALSFAVMLILVGVPLWWKTTEVYRVSLPYSEIDELQDANFKIFIDLHVLSLDQSKGQSLIDGLKEYIRHSPYHHVRSYAWTSAPKQLLGACKSIEELDRQITHPFEAGNIQLVEVPGLSRFTPQKVIIGANRTMYYASDASTVAIYGELQARFLNDDHLNRTLMHVQAPPEGRLDAECSRRVSPSPEFDILVTVLNPDPDNVKLELDLPKAIHDYMDPQLAHLEDLNKLHVKSQWLHMVGLQVTPQPVEGDIKHFALPESILPHVITPLEKKLSSHVSKNPCLNFVLWVPPCKISPLHIYTSTGKRLEGYDAFLSPRWGGIQIYNPPADQCELAEQVTATPDMGKVMAIFLHQLRILLGVPSVDEDVAKGAVLPAKTILRTWEKDALLKSRTIEQMTIAKHTLQSLSKLLGQINNIVINDHIGASIYESLEAIKNCEKSLRKNALQEAYRYSQTAFVASEAAFTDPSLLALLYFPEDQKYAVYIPLFLPVMIPVLISFKALREWCLIKFIKDKFKRD